MAVFIELITEPFRAGVEQFIAPSRRAGAERVRRPLRGLEVKDDTYAVIKVIRADGSSIPLMDQSNPTGQNTETSSFIIQSAQEARMEKHQIIETFGESYLFLFGEAPRFLDVTALLINSHDFNWEAEWWENYDNYLRGTRSVELGARTFLFFDDSIVEGYMLQAQSSKVSDQPFIVSMNFRLFVTNYRNVSLIGDPNFPIRASIVLPEGVPSLTEPMSSDSINALVGQGTSDDASLFQQGGFDLSSGAPLRATISKNYDEYTAGPPQDAHDPFEALKEWIDADLERMDSVIESAMSQLGALGVDTDNPNFMMALGLGPSFNYRSGVRIGASARASASASFGVSASASIGASASAGAGARAGFGASARASASAGAGAFARAGASASASAGVSAGIGFSAGASTRASFGGSFLGAVSSGASTNGLSAGASSSVGGDSSAFAMASFDGDLGASAGVGASASASAGI